MNIVSLDWRGAQVLEKVLDAAMGALDETASACASTAASARSGSVANITAEPAEMGPTGPSVRWGLFPEPRGNPFYELFHETGTPFLPGDNAKRNAADQHYGELAALIRGRLG